jgi:hypothetical protein
MVTFLSLRKWIWHTCVSSLMFIDMLVITYEYFLEVDPSSIIKLTLFLR